LIDTDIDIFHCILKHAFVASHIIATLAGAPKTLTDKLGVGATENAGLEFGEPNTCSRTENAGPENELYRVFNYCLYKNV